MEIEPWPVEVSLLLGTVFRNHGNFAGCIVSDTANTIATAAKTPVTFDSAHGPGAISGRLVSPWATEKIIPALLQPAATDAAR